MLTAIEQREAITPELLRVLETVAADPAAWSQRQDYMLHVFGAFLLAQFREKAAYLPLVKIASAPGELPHDLFGGTITERFNSILASVYDGDPKPLQGLIESETVNDFVRGVACETFLVLSNSGQMSREAVVEYYASLFRGRLPRDPVYIWTALVCAVAELPAPELLEDVRQAYRDELVDSAVETLERIEHELAAPTAKRPSQYRLIINAIEEMEWWDCFQPKERVGRRALRRTSWVPTLPNVPLETAPRAVRAPKIGRNDPCPCGSGKKYKKCCGNS